MINLEKLVLGASSIAIVLGVFQLRENNSSVKELKEQVKEMKEATKDAIDGVNELGKEMDQVRSILRSNGTKVSLSPREVKCLQRNVFFEAGVEPMEGKIAVAQVTWNRMKMGRWSNDACKVVYARKQFSWTLQRQKVNSNPKGKLWEESKKAVEKFLSGERIVGLEKATHYHATWMKQKPKWAKEMTVSLEVGQHVFY